MIINFFFFFFHEMAINNQDTFFVAVDSIEPINENEYEILVSGIQSWWVNEYVNQNSSFVELADNMGISYFRITLRNDSHLDMLALLNGTPKDRNIWLTLKVNDVAGLPLSYATEENLDNDNGFQERFIEWLAFLNPRSREVRWLNKFFSLDSLPSTNRFEFQEALDAINIENKTLHANIYNVGQGNLNALCTEDEIPQVYFDLGGGFCFNRRTYPNTLRLCWTEAKTVILSHWDMDHLETARRLFQINDPKLNGVTWIVPRQTLKPSYSKIAAKMFQTGRLLLWPKRVRRVQGKGFEIIKCSGKEHNDAGLAVIVHSGRNMRIHDTLLPGDAAYKFIKIGKRTLINGLAATHHGAKFQDNNFPLPNVDNGYIAYSYASTRYGHPNNDAVRSYMNNGWTNRKDTYTDNHISLRIPPQQCALNNCNNQYCDLCVLSYF